MLISPPPSLSGLLSCQVLRSGKERTNLWLFLKRIFETLKLLNSSLWRENWTLNYLLYFKLTDRSNFENFAVLFENNQPT